MADLKKQAARSSFSLRRGATLTVKDSLTSDVKVGAQNISTDKGFGAYTGELTAELFVASGITYTLVGHSERRRRKQTRRLGHDEASPRLPTRPSTLCLLE